MSDPERVNAPMGTEWVTDPRPPVPGTVRLMTEEPLVVDADPEPGMPRQVVGQLRERPWLIALLVLGVVALIGLRRRR